MPTSSLKPIGSSKFPALSFISASDGSHYVSTYHMCYTFHEYIGGPGQVLYAQKLGSNIDDMDKVSLHHHQTSLKQTS